jgi:hypothetical protein
MYSNTLLAQCNTVLIYPSGTKLHPRPSLISPSCAIMRLFRNAKIDHVPGPQQQKKENFTNKNHIPLFRLSILCCSHVPWWPMWLSIFSSHNGIHPCLYGECVPLAQLNAKIDYVPGPQRPKKENSTNKNQPYPLPLWPETSFRLVYATTYYFRLTRH